MANGSEIQDRWILVSEAHHERGVFGPSEPSQERERAAWAEKKLTER